ncbi:serine/threonine-protein kinase [Trujillonella humicola]|uniref:serine/threonine-protein kinase n=1 Tax=Trujillonella humicola TaxID=3383699 RepID=UPI0039062515
MLEQNDGLAAEPPVVPGYRLETLLGRGGSGEVWRAVPRGGGEAVAVKVLVAGDPERQAREAALLGELDHPHLVRLVEVVHQPRRGGRARVALVLDLLEGGSLAALLARRGRLRPGEVVTTIAPVAAALASAHAAGVVHGDLSPGNVVFTAEGRPVLTDLGVARVLGETAAGEVTPAYVDPTVARGGAPGPASDVFGVAAAAFHALTGVAPWNAATPADTLAVAAAGELPDLDLLAPEAPPALRDVITRGLAPDPADRPTAAELALDLRHACRPEPVRLPTAGVPDAELGATGRGPRTELTHQVARRPRQASEGARRRRRPLGVLHGRWSRVAGGLLAVATLLAAAGAVGGVWAGTAPRPAPAASAGTGAASTTAPPPVTAQAPPPVSTTAGPPGQPEGGVAQDPGPDWVAVLTELYARRADAFTRADAAALDAVYTPGSPLRAADEQAVARLAAAGHRLTGYAPRVEGPAQVTGSGDLVRVEVRDGWAGYAVVAAGDPDGRPLLQAPGRSPAPVVLELVRTSEGWRIDSAGRTG